MVFPYVLNTCVKLQSGFRIIVSQLRRQLSSSAFSQITTRKMVFLTSYISGKRQTLIIKPKNSNKHNVSICSSDVVLEDIIEVICQKEGTSKDVFLSCEGKPISPNDRFSGDANIVATLRLRGGKGGFGSMLRAIGAQIEKTTNREACRDLSGRRLRDINEEKRLKEFLAKKVEKENEMLEQKRKKLEQLKEGPKHTFEDKTYFEQREKRERDIYDSLDKAFSSTSGETTHRPEVESETKRKKVLARRFGSDLDASSEEDSESEGEDEKSSSSDKVEDGGSSNHEAASQSNCKRKENGTDTYENVKRLKTC